MSNNPYRRYGATGPGNHANQGNDYYRNNAQYHNNNRNMNPNHAYPPHQGHGYSRSHYNNHGSYRGNYSRHNSYHSSQPVPQHSNARYHHSPPFQHRQPPYTEPNGSHAYGHVYSEAGSTFSSYNNDSYGSKQDAEKITNNVFSSRRRSNEDKSVVIKTKPFSTSKSTSPTLHGEAEKSEKKVIDVKKLQPMKKLKSEPSFSEHAAEKLSDTSSTGIDLFERKSSNNSRRPSDDANADDERKIHEKTDIKQGSEMDTFSNENQKSSKINDSVTSDISQKEVSKCIISTEIKKEESDTNVKTAFRQGEDADDEDANSKIASANKTDYEKDDDHGDDDDEDEIITSSKRVHHTDLDSRKIVESEEETDHEETLPVPSKKSRKLHRLLQEKSSIDDVSDDNADEVIPKPMKKIRRKGSRSQSPKQRKSSRSGRDASGRTQLQRMCAKGNIDEVKRLLNTGSNVNDADFAGITPLHEAALEGHLEIVELLIKHGADINIQSGQMDKDTPLIDAVSNLHYKVVKYLLKNGANPMIENSQNENSLLILDNTIADIEKDQEVDSNQAKANEENLQTAKKIKRLLQTFAKKFDAPKPSKKKVDKKYVDEELGLSYSTLRIGGLDSLYERIRANDVTFILNYVSSANGKKIPPEALLLASKLGFPDIASLLIAFGADINYKDKSGFTPLMHAVGNNHLEMVKLLLSNQVDLSLKDNKGRTALAILESKGLTNSDEYELLKQKMNENGIRDKMEVDGDLETEAHDIDSETDDQEVDESVSYVDSSYIDSNDKNESDSTHKRAHEESNNSGQIKPFEEHKLESTNRSGDVHPNKRAKIAKEDIRSTSPSTTQNNIRPVKEEIVEAKVPEPTIEELNAKKLKEIEAKKAREALEHQRNERKKLKQQEIAKRIDAFEKQREEEKKAEEREELERKKREEDVLSRQKHEAEEQKRKEIVRQESEKRKLIRSYYPYELRYAGLDGKSDKCELEKYCPLYVFKIGDEEYVVDLQLYLLLDVENLNNILPNISTKRVRDEEKSSLWKFLWPRIGAFRNFSLKTTALCKEFESEGEKFKVLLLNWINFEKLQRSLPEDSLLKEYMNSGKGICRAELNPNRTALTAPASITVSDSNISSPFAISGQVSDTELNLPLRFGRRAKESLKLLKQNLW